MVASVFFQCIHSVFFIIMALSHYGSFTGYRMQPNGTQCTSCICRCVWVKKNREHKEIFETLPCERNGANRSASTSAFPDVRPGLLSRSLPPYTSLFPLPQAHTLPCTPQHLLRVPLACRMPMPSQAFSSAAYGMCLYFVRPHLVCFHFRSAVESKHFSLNASLHLTVGRRLWETKITGKVFLMEKKYDDGKIFISNQKWENSKSFWENGGNYFSVVMKIFFTKYQLKILPKKSKWSKWFSDSLCRDFSFRNKPPKIDNIT